MSVNATKWAWDLRGVKYNQKIVLLCIADHADKFGQNAFPGAELIADECGMSRAAVFENLERLEKSGLLVRRKRHKEGGQRSSNKYTLPINQNPESGLGEQETKVQITETKVQITPHQSPASGREPSVNRQYEPSERGSVRCPPDFIPSDKTAQGVLDANPELTPRDLNAGLEQMKKHTFAKPRKNWNAVFSNWMNRYVEFGHNRKKPDMNDTLREFISG